MSAQDPAHPLNDPDHIYDTALERAVERAPTRFDRFILRITKWFGEHTIIRLVVVGALMIGAVVQAAIFFIYDDEIAARLEGASYISIFLTNLASTATFLIPVPGLTAAAQALIIDQGADARFPWLIGVAGGLGMAVGEITAYYAGYLGSEFMRGRDLPGPKRFHGIIQRVVGWIDWLMDHWGMPTLFVLSAIPNPVFEIAGITAGSVHMKFREFFVAVTAGKIVRGIMLAYLGTWLPFV